MAEEANQQETGRSESQLPTSTEESDGIDSQGRPKSAEGADGKEEAGRQGNSDAEDEDAKARMKEFESQDKLPSDLKEWPDGKAKFITFGEEDDAPYGEGATGKLGPQVTYHDDGSISADGEKVENPDEYRGEPIPLAVEGMDAPEVGGGSSKGEDGEQKDTAEAKES